MPDPVFFPAGPGLRLSVVAQLGGVALPDGADDMLMTGVAALEDAGPFDVAYMNNGAYRDALAETRAGACLVGARFSSSVPDGCVPLVVRDPYAAYAGVLARLHPEVLRPGTVFDAAGVAPGSVVHPTARLEPGVVVDPGVVIGPRVEIGRNTRIAANAVIGADVRIGRDCSIGAGASILCSLIGNRVILHPGARLGQDGFGFAPGPSGHRKVPQIGRVIVQDDVEIGANTTVDRGATRDTVIGEGTKIDNLVQIAHNVSVGRHCMIVAQTGISGSAVLEDHVVLAGQVGVVGHVRIGRGAQIAGSSNVNGDVPPGARWGGTPAKPVRDWFRELTTLKLLASRRVLPKDGGPEGAGASGERGERDG